MLWCSGLRLQLENFVSDFDGVHYKCIRIGQNTSRFSNGFVGLWDNRKQSC